MIGQQFKNRNDYELALGTLRYYAFLEQERGRFYPTEPSRLTPAEQLYRNAVAADCVSYALYGFVRPQRMA